MFDPENPEHRKIFARFLITGKWSGTTFHIEAPHMTVPATVVNKLLLKELAAEIASVSE